MADSDGSLTWSHLSVEKKSGTYSDGSLTWSHLSDEKKSDTYRGA